MSRNCSEKRGWTRKHCTEKSRSSRKANAQAEERKWETHKNGTQIVHLSRKLFEKVQSTVPSILGTSCRRGERLICAHALSSADDLIEGTRKRSQTKFPIWPSKASKDVQVLINHPWGALSQHIMLIQGNLNSQKYTRIPDDLFPYADAKYPEGGAHISAETSLWITRIKKLLWLRLVTYREPVGSHEMGDWEWGSEVKCRPRGCNSGCGSADFWESSISLDCLKPDCLFGWLLKFQIEDDF